MSGLRLGLVGCGGIADFVASFARLTPGMGAVACCDRTLPVAGAFARKHHIPRVYDDYRALVADERVDAVYIAVPHHLHFAVLEAALQAGKPVLCEKPITRTLAEGQAIVRMAEAAGVKVGVNYQYRYDRAAYALANAARTGLLGRLLYARCNLPWSRSEEYFTQGAWRASLASAGGGTLLTQGSHLLDLALWAMGSPPLEAVGMTAQRKFSNVEVEDLAQGILTLADGGQIAISSGMVAAQEQALRLEIYGESGTAIYTDRPWPRVTFLGVRGRAPALPVRGLHALHSSLIGFRDWLALDRPYLTPAREALPVLAAVEAIYRAAQSGQKVTVGGELPA